MTRLNYFKQSKYGAVKQTYGGYSYDSRAEARFAAELDLRVRAKDIKEYDRQFPIKILAPDGSLICTYKCDFRLHLNNGKYELVEVKGFETDTWRLKKKLLEKIWLPLHPDHSYTVSKV